MSWSPKYKKSRVGIRNAVSPNPSWKINISQEFPVLVIKKLKNKHLARSLRTSHQKKFINQLEISRQMCLLLRLPGLPANLSYKPATSEIQTSKMGGEWDGRTFLSKQTTSHPCSHLMACHRSIKQWLLNGFILCKRITEDQNCPPPPSPVHRYIADSRKGKRWGGAKRLYEWNFSYLAIYKRKHHSRHGTVSS